MCSAFAAKNQEPTIGAKLRDEIEFISKIVGAFYNDVSKPDIDK